MVDDMTWTVKSQTAHTSTESYLVTMTDQSCPMACCSLKCTTPQCKGLCRHMYSCQCYDYSNGHICKHIHAVAMQNTDSEVAFTESMPAGSPCLVTTPDPVLKENLTPGSYNYIDVLIFELNLYALIFIFR